MTKYSSSNRLLPGGRHLSTVEIVCVCVILLVGYLVVSHLGGGPANEAADARSDAGQTGREPLATSAAAPTAPNSFRSSPVSYASSDAGAASVANVPALLERYAADHEEVVSASVSDTGTVQVVYEDGSTVEVPLLELQQNLPAAPAGVTLARADAGKSSQGFYRYPANDLKPRDSRVEERGANRERDENRTVQLATFKRLVTDGADAASREMRRAMENLIPEEMPVAIETVDALEWSPEARSLMQTTMMKWGESDPMAALTHAESYESLRKRNDAVSAVLNSFARTDPEGALRWYFDNLASDARTKSLNPAGIFKNMAEDDFYGALQQVNQIEDPTVRQTSLRYMLSAVGGDERFGMIEQLYHQSQDLNDRKMFAQEYVNGKARYQPYEAAEWIAGLEHPDIQAKAIDSLITHWSADRPDQAAEWVMRIADDKVRQKQLTTIARNWTRYDTEGAVEWLSSFPPDPDLDGAVSGRVAALRRDNPAEAGEWAERIYDPNRRSSAVRMVAKEWVRVDPAGARDYILQAEMAEKHRAQYLQIADRAIAMQQQLQNL